MATAMNYITFSWTDYLLFTLMFGLSCAIGIYFGCIRKQKTTADYLLGGKRMKVFPISMSLVASTLSGISLLGIPTEIYMHGTQYSMMVICFVVVGAIHSYVCLPVFYKLQLTTAFEYLRLRFNKKVKLMASFLYALCCFLSLPVYIYAPILALNQVTGFELYISAPVMCSICIFYTTIGGLKAVVWTDTLQFSVTLCTLTCILVMGTISVGGIGSVWEKSKFGDRLDFFIMDPDPTVRTTFWSIVVGNIFQWTAIYAIDAGVIQRAMAVPTLKDAQNCTIIYVIISIITKLITCFFGLIMYAKYYDCDPLSAGYIKRADQILPYYVLEEATAIPGLSGLFVAGLFSTALSALSTYLNILSGIFYTDFISPFLPNNISESKASTLMKIVTVVLGFICIGLVFIVERLGSILEVLITLKSIAAGPILGLFTIGMIFPFGNYKGALCGSIGSLLIMCWILIKTQIYRWNGTIKNTSKPLYTHGCNLTTDLIPSLFINSTVESFKECPPEEPLWLYRISVHYYFAMSIILSLIIGLPISWISGNIKDLPVNPDYLSPVVKRFLSTRYQSVELQEVATNTKGSDLKETTFDKLLGQ